VEEKPAVEEAMQSIPSIENIPEDNLSSDAREIK